MKISVIIPTLNEASALRALLPGLIREGVEVLVVDGGSADATLPVAREFHATIVQSRPGRAAQMNAGAQAATGDWLWFLHADTVLPPDWEGQLRRAMEAPAVVGGGFRSVIDAPGAGYRFLDAWGRLRTRIQRSFYGDQGIFVRRNLFERLGGFAEIPVCEDAEFSGRMWRAGRVAILPGPIRTSARRWQRYGFWRTVAAHSAAVLRYFANRRGRGGTGSSRGSARLNVRYLSVRRGIHIVVMAKAPVAGRVKTRLIPPLTPEQAAELAQVLLEDTIRQVRRIPGLRCAIAVEPADAIPLLQATVQATVFDTEVIPQPVGDLGARMSAILDERFARGAAAVLLIGSDHPTVPVAQLEQAVQWLSEDRDQVVMGPTADGGYYCVGLTRPHPELFQDIAWSGPGVFTATMAKAEALHLPVRMLAPWYDVDTVEDLARLQRELAIEPSRAPACAGYLRRFGPALAHV